MQTNIKTIIQSSYHIEKPIMNRAMKRRATDMVDKV